MQGKQCEQFNYLLGEQGEHVSIILGSRLVTIVRL